MRKGKAMTQSFTVEGTSNPYYLGSGCEFHVAWSGFSGKPHPGLRVTCENGWTQLEPMVADKNSEAGDRILNFNGPLGGDEPPTHGADLQCTAQGVSIVESGKDAGEYPVGEPFVFTAIDR